MSKQSYAIPAKQGLYVADLEKDSCGVGFIAHIKGKRSHKIIQDAAIALTAMTHRGACGCEENTGDGAGIMTALPLNFLKKIAHDNFDVTLPEAGKFATGLVFLPQLNKERTQCKATVEALIAEHNQQFIGWRSVPVDAKAADIGLAARATEPIIEQLFIVTNKDFSVDAFTRELYLIRKQASHMLRNNVALQQRKMFYICSLSSKVIIYKGKLMPAQVVPYYPDLSNPSFTSHFAMIHSRFSTNTFPSWDRAQPNRFISHNGEINTMRGNKNWMKAREGAAKSQLFGDKLNKIFPVIEADCSDSGTFDNVLEFLVMTGRTLQEAVMMMVPEAWQNHATMSAHKRAFYKFNSAITEPWDGPAAIVFTDGNSIGAVLDRNGLRPGRYYLTHDNQVIMASEVGVVSIAPENIKYKGRLQPGRMFLVDFEQGRLLPDDELKNDFATRHPYQKWLQNQQILLSDLQPNQEPHGFYPDTLLERMQAFGFTSETMKFMLLPMVSEQRDPLGSMGNDSSLACLSDQPRMLYDYFKQLFAQVTNPAIDSIREEIIMSLECYIGPELNLVTRTEQHCHRLLIEHPILSNTQLAAIKYIDHRGWKTKTIDITWEKTEANAGLVKALDRICHATESAIANGFQLVILSDRATNAGRIALPTLLATATVHHHLVRQCKRTRIGIVVETAEAREVHHHCLLIGYGADAINPYLAFEALWQARTDGLMEADMLDDAIVVATYRKAVAKGMLKVMAKMGISTLQSYKGAQIFEAVGICDQVIERCFTGTASRIQGVGFAVITSECIRRHTLAYPVNKNDQTNTLINPGEFYWRTGGERHMWDPQAIVDIQMAARNNNHKTYHQFANHSNKDAKTRCSIKGLLDFKKQNAIAIDQVEPATAIIKRFCTGAMSFGSISVEAHEALAIAMNRLGGKSNTGEGGEDPARFQPLANGDSKRSAIKQIASGRFGVTIYYLNNADELQIKISQGAKPGEGGELPGKKIDSFIARIRHSTPGVGLISPPPHHDIYSIEDLAQLIFDLKNSNPSARISVKLVAEVGVGTIASGVAKAHADHILIAGDGGGTGASPLTSIKHAGLPWELGVAETHQTLVMNDLRSRITLQTDGGLKTGRDVVIAALLGAEEFGFSTAPLITLGCIMMRKCHLNTCPVGIATQDKALRKKFRGKPEYVVNYLFMVAEEARQLMAQLGFTSINAMIGRTDILQTNAAITHWKADGLDLTALLTPASKPHPNVEVYKTISQDHGLDKVIDNQLISLAQDALENGKKVTFALPIINTDRAVGTLLSHKLVQKWGIKMLPDNTINIKFNGSAGQSFGAFLAQGINLEITGDANDYVGKGLSGGNITVYPPKNSSFEASKNIIVGNVCLYGATAGLACFRGRAAERFAVRNSGANTVIEGVGDHACEYMTGGRVVILGPTGRNFAAGMSGGIAYVWDYDQIFTQNCNLATVELESVIEQNDIDQLYSLIKLHLDRTGSTVAKKVLHQWISVLPQFVKVMPTDYKRILAKNIQQNAVGAIING